MKNVRILIGLAIGISSVCCFSAQANAASLVQGTYTSETCCIKDLAVVNDAVMVGLGDYYISKTGGIDVLSVTTPSKPERIAHLDDATARIDAAGTHAFLAPFAPVSGEYLQIVDMSNPSKPSIIGHFTRGQYGDQSSDIAVSGNTAFVVDGRFIKFFDISDRTSPRKLDRGITTYANYASDISVKDNYLYVAGTVGETTNAGIKVFDVSDLDSPKLISELAIPGSPTGDVDDDSGLPVDTTVSGTTMFVASRKVGVTLLDVSDPAHPRILATYDTPGDASGLSVLGNRLFIADTTSLLVLDITDPSQPRLVWKEDTPATAVTSNGHFAYIGDRESGKVSVLDISLLDAEPVRLSLNGDRTVYVRQKDLYVDEGAMAFSPTSGDVSSRIVTRSNVDTSRIGQYTVTHTLTGDDGKEYTEPRNVIVQKRVADITIRGSNVVIWTRNGRLVFSPFQRLGYEKTFDAKIVKLGNNKFYIFTNKEKVTSGAYMDYFVVFDQYGNKKNRDGLASISIYVKDSKGRYKTSKGLRLQTQRIGNLGFIAVGQVSGSGFSVYRITSSGAVEQVQDIVLSKKYSGKVVFNFKTISGNKQRLVAMIEKYPSTRKAFKYFALQKKFLVDKSINIQHMRVIKGNISL